MSINKFAVSVALAGILGASSALAETDGAFVGGQLGAGWIKLKLESKYDDGVSHIDKISESDNGFRYGFIVGYKRFFTPEFGVRYYGVIDFGGYDNITNETFNTLKITVNALNLNANADAIYNFVTNDSLDFGIFGGLSLGYTSYYGDDGYGMSGFDLGINFGVKAQIVQKHGIEIYSRFDLLEQKKDFIFRDYDGSYTETDTYKLQQPYAVGLRYTYSF